MNVSRTLQKITTAPVAHVLMSGLLTIEVLGTLRVIPISDKPIWLGVLGTTIGAWAFIGLMRWRQHHVRDMRLTEWAAALIVALVYLDSFGNMFDIYDSWRWFDVVVHVSSGIVGTAVMWQILYSFQQHYALKVPLWVSGFLALCILSFAGVITELLEFVADEFYGIEYWLGGRLDTAGDLASNTVGGLLVLAVGLIYQRLRPRFTRS